MLTVAIMAFFVAIFAAVIGFDDACLLAIGLAVIMLLIKVFP